MATFPDEPVCSFARKRLLREYKSSLIPGTSTAGSLSGPRNPCTVVVIGSPNAPCIEYVDDLDMSVIFHCCPTPDVPPPESRICREDLTYTDIIRFMLLAMRTFILGFFVGVAYFVTFLLSGARIAISILGTGSEDEGVGSEVGTVAGGDSECLEEDSESDEEVEE